MKPTYETLLALAEAMLNYTRNGQRFVGKLGTIYGADHDAVVESLEALRAAIRPPLRTREEVDAEIASHVRSIGQESFAIGARFPHLAKLCAEPTREPEAGLPWDCPNCRSKA